MSNQNVLFIVNPGPRPPFGRVADHLWDPDADVDTDGNSSNPNDTNWTELTVQLRPDLDDLSRIDVDPVSESPLVLKVMSSSSALAEWALLFLVSVLALLLCPILIGVVAAKIGKSGIIWGGLSFLCSPFGQLVGYFKIRSVVEEVSSAMGRAQFEQAISR